ncbi:NERD domain-containing protein [Haloechinothrix sp. LS1_15]|uniref:NERD domain-containing protein n=1 Tax=Haloechinothrix sp. LS1_15 TaxID=2652248 RepID=UPI00294B2E6C|nr:NERD domain-containing protein [Haloechinothrix sp. LS1_15]
MAARVAPDGEVGLDPAEQYVIEQLRMQLPPDATVIPNLRITTRKGDREADAVMVWPGVGVAVIEVKAGPVVYANGHWWSSSARKARRLRPFDQARECKYALRDILRRHPRWCNGDPRMAHHVVMPHTSVSRDFVAPHCPREILSDRDDVPVLASRIATQLGALVDAPPPPDTAQATSLATAFTGPQHVQADLASQLAAELAHREHRCELLTAQQAKVLDMLREQSRVQILGGAGTGKTWLAVEQARRLAARGQRVALLCYSRGLSTWLKRRVQALPPGQRPVFTGTFHALGYRWGAWSHHGMPEPHQWESEVPTLMLHRARELSESERFHAAVIDEIQDFAPSWWDPICAALSDRERACLVAFADEGQAVFSRGAIPDAGFTRIVLDENVRNTEPITRAFEPYGERPLTPLGGPGADVQWIDTTPDRAIETADDQVRQLLENGWQPGHIMLLTTGHRHPEHSRVLNEHSIEQYWNAFWEGKVVFHGTVSGSKGLERPAVVLALNGPAHGDRARALRYVGMSRARDLLIACGPR